jgi:hypothetical protein
MELITRCIIGVASDYENSAAEALIIMAIQKESGLETVRNPTDNEARATPPVLVLALLLLP